MNWSRCRGSAVAVLTDLGLLLSRGVNKTLLRRSKTRQWKVWAEKIVVEEPKRGPCLKPAESVVLEEDVGHVVTKAQDASAMSLVVNGVGRSKDYLIWRWCDPNNCLHCGLALRTKHTMRRVCAEQCTCCRRCSRILNYCSLCRLHRSLCSTGMSWTRWRDWRVKRRCGAWHPTHECELSLSR